MDKLKEIIIGGYYIDDMCDDIVRVDCVESNTVHLTLIEDPSDIWKESYSGIYDKEIFISEYKYLPGYNTPLWKALNG